MMTDKQIHDPPPPPFFRKKENTTILIFLYPDFQSIFIMLIDPKLIKILYICQKPKEGVIIYK